MHNNVPMEVMVGLYFYHGTNVTMCHVTVRDGDNALGVLMYDIDGTVNVYHSNFINNAVSDDSMDTKCNWWWRV